MPRPAPSRVLAGVVLAAITLLTGCTRAAESEPPPVPDQGPAPELRLGYFPNITHAPALIGLQDGLFARELGGTKLTPATFNAGPEETSALLGESLDVGFIGSGPAINAYKQDPHGVRILAGATAGGAQLVVRPGITDARGLLGRKIASPQLGNTQDISLKAWLAANHLPIGTGPGAVEVINLDNARAFDAYRTGQVDGGWLPEPYASRLVVEAGATQLLDERSLWPGGQFPSTVVIARTEYVQAHPATVAAFLRGLLAAEDRARTDPRGAAATANAALRTAGSKPLAPPVLARAWSTMTFAPDPLAGTYPRLTRDAVTAQTTTRPTNVVGMLDVGPLDRVLADAGRPPVDAAGLGR